MMWTNTAGAVLFFTLVILALMIPPAIMLWDLQLRDWWQQRRELKPGESIYVTIDEDVGVSDGGDQPALPVPTNPYVFTSSLTSARAIRSTWAPTIWAGLTPQPAKKPFTGRPWPWIGEEMLPYVREIANRDPHWAAEPLVGYKEFDIETRHTGGLQFWAGDVTHQGSNNYGYPYWEEPQRTTRLVTQGGTFHHEVPAHCNPGLRHGAAHSRECPNIYCTCGYYSLKDEPEAYGPASVICEVAVWGTVIEHEQGYRSSRLAVTKVLRVPFDNEEIRKAIERVYVEGVT